MKTEHKYAQVLRWIADGEHMQWQSSNGQWLDESAEGVLQEILSDKFVADRYRIKPKIIMIGDVECEAPVLEPYETQRVWEFNIATQTAMGYEYEPKTCCFEAKAGALFASKEACLAAHDAITKLLTQSK